MDKPKQLQFYGKRRGFSRSIHKGKNFSGNTLYA